MKKNGFSLIELMVALVIGLLISLGAASMATSLGAARQNSVASNTASANGSTSLTTLSSSLAMTGAGLLSNQSSICTTLYASSHTNTISGDAFNIVGITAGTNSYVLKFAYGTGGSAASMLSYNGTLTTLNDDISIANNSSLHVGDDILLGFSNTASGACVLRTVSGIINPSAAIATINMAETVNNHNGTFVGTAPSFSDFYIIPLKKFVYQSWYAEDGLLKMKDLVSGTVNIIADGVLYLRAQYGVNTGTGLVWQDIIPAQISTIKSIRVALVIRSGTHEKQASANDCTTTTTSAIALGTQWVDSDDQPINIDISTLTNTAGTSLLPDWKCYSYKAYTSVTPLRSLMWGSAS